MTRILLVVPLLSACIEARTTDVQTVDVSRATRAVVDVTRGDVTYRGLGGLEARVDISSWGRGSGQDGASRNEAGNTWDVAVSGGDLLVTGSSTFGRAGVDVDIEGPDVFDLDLRTGQGVVRAVDTLGTYNLEGFTVETTRLEGEGRILATDSVDAELYPYVDGDILVDSGSAVTLRLPAFGPYDLRVTGVDAELFEVADIGFDELVVIDETTLSAYRHPGTTRIRVTVGSTFRLLEAL